MYYLRLYSSQNSKHVHINSKKLTDIFNESKKISKFPQILKKHELTIVYKKDDINERQNYRPNERIN